jgi:class 3 adenylate cyclase
VPRQLLERETELERAAALLDGVQRRRGGCLVIEGPAGIGKSSLVQVSVEDARSRGFRALTARGAELERDFGYGVVRQLLEPVVRDAPAASVREMFSGAAALAAPLLAPEVTVVQAPAGPDAGFAVQHGLYWLVDELAAQSPVLLVVDDAQWADLSSLRFLLYLARRLEDQPIGVLVGWRTGEPGSPMELLRELTQEEAATTVAPDPLTPEGTERLVRTQLGRTTDPRFCRACHETTGGNPFLVTELVGAVAHGELQATVEATERLRELGPAAIARSVFVRLSRLPAEAAELARAVAVLDADSELPHVARLAGLDVERAVAAAADLEKAGILAAARPLRFAHPILRGAVYGDVGRLEQERLHRLAGRVLDDAGAADRAAAHLLATEPAGDPWLAGRLAAAGERAIQRGATETALDLLRRALAEPPPEPERANVQLLLGTAEQLAGDPAAAATLRAAMNASAEPSTRWQAAHRLARQMSIRQQHEDAVAVLDRLLEEQRQVDPQVALETEAHIAFNAVLYDPLAAAASHRIEQVAAGCAGDTPAERMVLVAAAFSRALAMRGTAAEVLELIDRARPQEFTALVHRSSVGFWSCGALLWAGRPDRARKLADELLAEARRTGGAIWVASALMWLSTAAHALGDLRDSEAYLEESFDAARGNFPLVQVAAVSVAAELLRLRGEPDAADATFASYGLSEAAGPANAFSMHLHAWRARLRVQQHRVPEALADADRLLASGHERGGLIAGLRPEAALALAAAGRHHEASALAELDLDEARRWGDPGVVGIALRTLGTLQGGPEGLERLEEAVSVLTASPYRAELAAALVARGAALRRAQQRQAAREPLTRGMDLAQRCGALALAERAREELRAVGVRPRQLLATGIDALTASERRVAQLAAQGMTNREIAQTLFVTSKTVETHLRHVFQKLNVAGRGELSAAIEAGDGGRTCAAASTRTLTETEAKAAAPERAVVAIIVFTDLVDSTRRQSQIGDRRWRDVQVRHEQLVRTELARAGGQEIKFLGDGFLAKFGSATSAVRCGQRLTAAAPAALGLAMRVSVHAGEVELTDGDVRGVAVNIAARLLALSGPGEVMCSGTVADLASGTGLRFEEKPAVQLKGIDGRWRVYVAR